MIILLVRMRCCVTCIKELKKWLLITIERFVLRATEGVAVAEDIESVDNFSLGMFILCTILFLAWFAFP
jgi:hypothetical protein